LQERIELLRKLVALIPSTQLHLLPPLLSEVILSTKEANEKSREAAFELLVVMGQKMASGGSLDRSLLPGMEQSMEHDSKPDFSYA
jgi:ribosomal RNA-processing protein 12